MTFSLRSLLVAAVTLSTALVGMRDTLAAVRTATDAICSVEGDTFHGSREDDSGTKSEQAEEEDGDEDEGRDLHLFGAAARVCRQDPAVRALKQSPSCRASHLLCRDALVRGPPALG